MTPDNSTSLTPDERALAARLAQLGPHGEPSAALDARILAGARASTARASTARDSTTGSTRPPARPVRRWPVALGVAASVLLAVGIAWRLRPLPDTGPVYRSEAASASPSTASTTSASDAYAQSASVERAQPTDASALDMATATPAQTLEKIQYEPAEPEQANAVAAPAPPAPQEPQIVFDVPDESKQATGLPAPPPAPQAFGRTAPSSPARTDSAAGSMPDEQLARDAAAEAEQASDATMRGMRSDEPLDEVPPATADSPAVRDAWLQRIRELADAGDIESARASLHEFVRRYPTFALPPDLRALER